MAKNKKDRSAQDDSLPQDATEDQSGYPEDTEEDTGDEDTGNEPSSSYPPDETAAETKVPFCKPVTGPDGVMAFNFGNGEVLSVHPNELPEEQQENLKYHGILQKVRDSFSSAKGDYAYAISAASKVIENLKNNKWVAGREASEAKPKTGELAQALANLKNVTLDVAQAAVDRATDEKRKQWRNNAAVAAEIANIRAVNARARAEKAKSEELTIEGL